MLRFVPASERKHTVKKDHCIVDGLIEIADTNPMLFKYGKVHGGISYVEWPLVEKKWKKELKLKKEPYGPWRISWHATTLQEPSALRQNTTFSSTEHMIGCCKLNWPKQNPTIFKSS